MIDVATITVGTRPISMVITPATIPPRTAIGKQEKSGFASQTELINVITWNPPTSGPAPISYRIYRNAQLTNLLAEIPASSPLLYEHHNLKNHKTYTYFVVTIGENGNQSIPVEITINP